MKGCAECGGKPAGKPTPRVLEIVNNRKNTTIFHKVPYPASLGVPTDEEVKGLQYSNVLLVIEANNDAWLFSSDGVPTLLTRGDWQLLQDRVDQFDEEVQEVIRKANEALELAEETSEFAHAESKALRDITGALQRNLEQEVSDRTEAINDLKQQVEGELSGAVDTLREDLEAEATTRQERDGELQSQIDAINDKSDVVDVVGTKAELDAYDTSALGDNDVVKVLNDESHDGAITYYRWDKASSTWEYVGETGPYYTKSEVDEKIAENTPDVPTRAKNLPNYIIGDSSTTLLSFRHLGDVLQVRYPRIDLDRSSTTTYYIDTQVPVATSEKAGVMSAEDKRTLDKVVADVGDVESILARLSDGAGV